MLEEFKNKIFKTSFKLHFLPKKTIELISSRTNQTQTEIIENAILSQYMPKDEFLFSVISEDMLISQDTKMCLIRIFSESVISEKYRSEELVKYCQELELRSNNVLTGEEPIRYNLLKYLKTLMQILKNQSVKESDVKIYEMFIEELEEEPKYSHLINFYQLILKNWEICKNEETTFNALSGLIRLNEKLKFDSNNMLELYDILIKLDDTIYEEKSGPGRRLRPGKGLEWNSGLPCSRPEYFNKILWSDKLFKK